ncbi:uncharacterized protein EV422DRAFT_536801 [Fimicolochytrium jonesii]|uniref:uncharacterized protein n=1 Tax=Fimicolochytrium jonesii TaxID=1396493 RepID=UPI0022FDD5EE|nr:uncharacterized protein EV422DRAFT_536801 [Fimicolochytrium jonesii]KAI8818774.1 hypothetical protein EV422DRAFT_536801 [Fimicolochytrium jonesii]
MASPTTGISPEDLQCLARPAVQEFVKQNVETAVTYYAGPGILLGVSWPLAVAAFPIAVWRVYAMPTNVRSYLLLAASLVQFADISNYTYARRGTMDEASTYRFFLGAVVLSQLKISCTIAAAAFRFATVLERPLYRNLMMYGLTGFTFTWTILVSTLGIHSLNTSMRVTTTYWSALLGHFISYIIPGFWTFSRVLAKVEADVRKLASNTPMMGITIVRWANNFAVGITLLCAVAFGVVSNVFDAINNPYELPAIVLLSTTWLLAESSFEIITRFALLWPATRSIHTASGSNPFDPNNLRLTHSGGRGSNNNSNPTGSSGKDYGRRVGDVSGIVNESSEALVMARLGDSECQMSLDTLDDDGMPHEKAK